MTLDIKSVVSKEVTYLLDGYQTPPTLQNIFEQRRSNKIRKVVFEVLPFVSFTIIAILVMSPRLLPGRTDVVMRALSLLQFLSQQCSAELE